MQTYLGGGVIIKQCNASTTLLYSKIKQQLQMKYLKCDYLKKKQLWFYISQSHIFHLGGGTNPKRMKNTQ